MAYTGNYNFNIPYPKIISKKDQKKNGSTFLDESLLEGNVLAEDSTHISKKSGARKCQNP